MSTSEHEPPVRSPDQARCAQQLHLAREPETAQIDSVSLAAALGVVEML